MAKKKQPLIRLIDLGDVSERWACSYLYQKGDYIYFKVGNTTTLPFSVAEAKEMIFGFTLGIEAIEGRS